MGGAAFTLSACKKSYEYFCRRVGGGGSDLEFTHFYLFFTGSLSELFCEELLSPGRQPADLINCQLCVESSTKFSATVRGRRGRG